ncbi:MAG: hypothetical protein WB762_30530, partial [Candidatus Sulfotelmatobacter sp.]
MYGTEKMRSCHSISAVVCSASIASIIYNEAQIGQTTGVPERLVPCQSMRQRAPANGTQNSSFNGVPWRSDRAHLPSRRNPAGDTAKAELFEIEMWQNSWQRVLRNVPNEVGPSRTAVCIHLNWHLSLVDFGWQKTSIRRESLGLIWQTNSMEMPLSP